MSIKFGGSALAALQASEANHRRARRRGYSATLPSDSKPKKRKQHVPKAGGQGGKHK